MDSAGRIEGPARAGRHSREASDGSYVTSARGLDGLHAPLLNRGTAFTFAERAELGLEGLLPAVYTAAAGIHPARGVPVALDVGTDNEQLRDEPVYLGNRHPRVRGRAYDEFIDAYVRTATRLFPRAMLHWEDFCPSNARRILERYRGGSRPSTTTCRAPARSCRR